MRKETLSTPLRKHAAIALAVGVALFAVGCGDKAATTSSDKAATAVKPQGAPKLTVATYSVAKKDWVHEVALDAEIVSLASPNIAAEVAGKVTQVLVEPGQSVKKGQPLAIINPSDLALTASDANAQAAQVAAQLADAQRTLKRNQELAAKEFIGRATLDASQTQVASLQEQLRAYQARATLAQSNLAKATIVAPFDAVVSQRNVAAGSYVRAGDTVVSLWSPKSSTLSLKVPQEHSGKVTPGQAVHVTWGDKVIETTVTHVRSDINAESRSFEAQAAVPKELQAVTGASLSAKLEIGRDAVLAVPAIAVQMAGGKAHVFVVGPDKKLVKKVVETGRQKDGSAEIVKGLTEGESVVVEGASFAQPGQTVEVKASPAEGAAQ